MATQSVSSKPESIQAEAFILIRDELVEDLSQVVIGLISTSPNEADLFRVINWLDSLALRARLRVAPDVPKSERVSVVLERAGARLDRLLADFRRDEASSG